MNNNPLSNPFRTLGMRHLFIVLTMLDNGSTIEAIAERFKMSPFAIANIAKKWQKARAMSTDL